MLSKLIKIAFLFTLVHNNDFLYATNTVSLSGNPPTFVINSAIAAGQGLQSVSNSSVTWGYTNGSTSQSAHITGQLSATISAGFFQLLLDGGGNSSTVTLSTTAQTLVSSIGPTSSATGQYLVFTFSANINGAHSTNSTVTLTLTMLNP